MSVLVGLRVERGIDCIGKAFPGGKGFDDDYSK